MDTLKDIWASLVASVRDRTTNPLTGAFAVSWCTWNFKFFVVLWGDGSSAERLRTIEQMYPHVAETYYGPALLYPAITALFYVFIYPFIGMWTIRAYRGYQVATANLVKRIESTRTITPQERDQLVRLHGKELTKLGDEIEALGLQLAATRSALVAAEEQLNVPDSQSPPPVSHLTNRAPHKDMPDAQNGGQHQPSDSELKFLNRVENPTTRPVIDDRTQRVLLLLSNYTTGISVDVVASNLKLNPTLVESELNTLKTSELVEFRPLASSWRLTAQGKALAIELIEELGRSS